jgi:Ca2+-binding RTX toxin-like protein
VAATGTDTLISIENVKGSVGSDTLIGSAGANVFFATGGNDTIAGLGGSDTLVGGLGNDTFVYFTSDFASGNIDSIVDFSLTSGNTDRLAFYGVSMSDLTMVESSGNTFISSTTAGGGGIMVMNTSIDALAEHMSFL